MVRLKIYKNTEEEVEDLAEYSYHQDTFSGSKMQMK